MHRLHEVIVIISGIEDLFLSKLVTEQKLTMAMGCKVKKEVRLWHI
jgi:hypothetical protein